MAASDVKLNAKLIIVVSSNRHHLYALTLQDTTCLLEASLILQHSSLRLLGVLWMDKVQPLLCPWMHQRHKVVMTNFAQGVILSSVYVPLCWRGVWVPLRNVIEVGPHINHPGRPCRLGSWAIILVANAAANA